MFACDYAKDRIYLPQEDMQRFGVDRSRPSPQGIATPRIPRAAARTKSTTRAACSKRACRSSAWSTANWPLDLDLFSRGGLEILRAIERQDYDVLRARPAISKSTKIALALRAVCGKLLPGLRLKSEQHERRPLDAQADTGSQPRHSTPPTQTAAPSPGAKPRISTTPSSPCPSRARNAICAIYAFMRKADDLSDDESSLARRAPPPISTRGSPPGISAASRRANRRSRLHRRARCRGSASTFLSACSTSSSPAPPWISKPHRQPTAPDTYATFADLYRYCYLVASVVGLVCIRIFGYTDPRAEKLAEETGIAFQLTNILRDVAEDAERNRVYLPLEDLAATT